MLLHLLSKDGMTISELKRLLSIHGMAPDLLLNLLNKVSIADLKELLSRMSLGDLTELLPEMTVAELRELLDEALLNPQTKRLSGQPPRDSVNDSNYTQKRHTVNGSDVEKALGKGKEAHIFNENENLYDLEQKVWTQGTYEGYLRESYRWVYQSEIPIGVRKQPGHADIPLYTVEIKGYYKNGEFVYHLVPRTGVAE